MKNKIIVVGGPVTKTTNRYAQIDMNVKGFVHFKHWEVKIVQLVVNVNFSYGFGILW